MRNPPEEPPCDTCRVELLEENAEAAKIYLTVQGQVRTVGDTVIDLDHVALWQAIDRYEVKKPLRVFELINRTFHYFLSKDRDEMQTKENKVKING
jgi:hypothetical protein